MVATRLRHDVILASGVVATPPKRSVHSARRPQKTNLNCKQQRSTDSVNRPRKLPGVNLAADRVDGTTNFERARLLLMLGLYTRRLGGSS